MKYFLSTLILLTIVSCSTKNSKETSKPIDDRIQKNSVVTAGNFNLTGQWNWENGSSTFDLNLAQSGDSLKGNYCAIANNGDKIDCHVNDNDDCNLFGRISGDVINLNFKSCYIGAIGQAYIKYDFSNDKLLWTLGKVDGEIYAPDSVILTRKKTSR